MDELMRLIRSEIRREKPYLVGSGQREEVKLNQNESPFDVSPEIKRTLMQEYEAIPFNRYPTEQPFRLMRRLEERFGRPEGSVLVGNGSNDLTHTLGLCFIDRNTRVVLPRPMFALYESVVRMHGGEVVGIPPEGGLRFDIDAVIEAASEPSVPLTIVASPNNPTGLAVPFAYLERLFERAAGFVVIDEAYQEFNTEPSVVSLLDRFPNLIVLRTLSKAYGLAGLRLGFLIAHPAVSREILKARLPFMIDRLSEAAALALTENPDLIAMRIAGIRASLDELRRELEDLPGISVLPTTTNFLLFRCGQDPGRIAARLADDGVIVRSMAAYPELDGCLRVTAGTEAENKAFVAALKRIL